MGSVGLHRVFLLLSLGWIRGIFGENVLILPLSSYLCEGSDPEYDYLINVRNINDDGVKVLDAKITLEDDFNANWQFVLKIDKWNNGDWEENFYNSDGPICMIINQYASRAWNNFRNQIDPVIPEACHINTGTYVLTSFNVSQTDYDIPVGILGVYRVTGKILDEVGAELLCQVVEVETAKT